MTCPKCGRAQPPDAPDGVFCVHCGQFLVATRWVARAPEAPAGSAGAGSAATPPKARYAGPPRYLSPPRWGFPAAPWRRGEPEPAPSSARAAAANAGLLVPLLRGLAALAALACAGEIWRYVLLLRSRSDALDAWEVAASDALLAGAAWVCTVTALVAGVLLLVWVLRAWTATLETSGVRPARRRWQVLAGWLVPGINLSVPGSVLAEIEHTALGRPPGARPRPSRLLLTWWALWAANVVLAGLTALWLLRSGVQARADGVVLHALVDALATATALVTARVVEWLTALVSPPAEVPLPRVVRVREGAASTVSRR